MLLPEIIFSEIRNVRYCTFIDMGACILYFQESSQEKELMKKKEL